jgi:hypothetical protein
VSHYEKQKTEAKGSITRFIVAIGPFYYDSRRCGLCHKTEKEVGHNLLSCAGGCHGLEQYCSKEHQKQDWLKHKFWCKKNATYTQYLEPPPRATEWN